MRDLHAAYTPLNNGFLKRKDSEKKTSMKGGGKQDGSRQGIYNHSRRSKFVQNEKPRSHPTNKKHWCEKEFFDDNAQPPSPNAGAKIEGKEVEKLPASDQPGSGKGNSRIVTPYSVPPSRSTCNRTLNDDGSSPSSSPSALGPFNDG